MFDKRSRYREVPTTTTTTRDGRLVTVVKLRRLPATVGNPKVVQTAEQLDVISESRYRDGARFWHIADANTELEANSLVEKSGRVIDVPES